MWRLYVQQHSTIQYKLINQSLLGMWLNSGKTITAFRVISPTTTFRCIKLSDTG
jgi:hypothetical protein